MKEKNCIAESCEVNKVHADVVEKARAAMPSDEILAEVAELFKVFGDTTRTRILSALFESEMCVCDIASLLNMTKSAVSHQLRILRQTKIVKYRKSGKEVYYSLDDGHIARIYRTALEHLEEE
ncbi:MAG: helix-turn-helix transcriptional regulator [Clostridia bacterium]|nr:helix-turn-helix transcriptional regulator [Clostridia bacterium]